MAIRSSKARKVSKAVPEDAADHSEDRIRLKRIRGQLEGIERMIAERRYCPDIMNQIRSATAALKSVEGLVMERHLRHCVEQAVKSRDPAEVDAKINEVVALFNKN